MRRYGVCNAVCVKKILDKKEERNLLIIAENP
jgi:hypothetical protein